MSVITPSRFPSSSRPRSWPIRSDALAEILGEYHDLALLEERSQNHPHLINVISARKKDLEKACFKAAGKNFRPAPSEFFPRNFRRALQ